MKRNCWLIYTLAAYLCITGAIAAFQFFVNSPDWRHAGIKGTDGQAYYAFLRSAVIDRDLNFENEFLQYNYNHHGFNTPDFFSPFPHHRAILQSISDWLFDFSGSLFLCRAFADDSGEFVSHLEICA